MKPLGCLWPLSIPWQAAVRTRNRLYDIKALTTRQVEAPVISVGNLSVGGTGKTPFVIHLVERLRNLAAPKKLNIGVVSRGYKGRAKNTLLVADRTRVLEEYTRAGDEPVLIAQSAKGTVVVVDRKRSRGARFAVDDMKVKLVLLDDGFQHRKLHRDLDIVLLDATNPLGNKRVLPAGFLREPVSALKRADIIVLSKARGEDEELTERALRLKDLLNKPVIVTRFVPQYWKRLDRTELLASEEIKGKKVAAFAGIAKPESFFDTVRDLGADLVKTMPLPDHCKYSKFYLDYISGHFIRSRSEWLVTTEKDALKLPAILRFLPLYFLESKMEVVAGEELLDEELLKILKDVN